MSTPERIPLNYIVPFDFDHFAILNPKPGCGGGKETFPGISEHALLTVYWPANSQEREAELEAMPGVIALGYPWEPVPADAVPILTAFHDALIGALTSGLSLKTSVPAPPSEADSAGRALHKLGRRQY